MRSLAGTLAAPFPYFGGKALACETVWGELGDPVNYVEPFAGSAAMLLGRPNPGKVETINDADGFVANFWRAVSHAPDAVTHHADWPCSEADLEARHAWLVNRSERLRDVRVTCGDWKRVVKDSVTTRHGLTGVFLDPPYTLGKMDYAAGGVGGELANAVREWCKQNGENDLLRIVLCGHEHEHDELLQHGWHLRTWTARKGYAVTDEAVANSASETLWCSPHCVGRADTAQAALFAV